MTKGRDSPGRIRFTVIIAFYLVILVLAVSYLLPNAERYRQLLTFSPGHVLLIVVIVVFPDRGLQNYVLYPKLGAPVSLAEAVVLSYVNTLANQLPFAGGMVTKGVYLKQRYRLPYTRFFGATVGLLVIAVSVGGSIGLATIGYLVFTSNEAPPWILVVAFAIMAFTAAMLWLPIPIRLFPSRWRERLNQLLSGTKYLAQHRELILRLALLQLLTVLNVSVRLWAAFRLMSQNIPLSYCLVFAAATLLTQLVSVAPGGLGVREAIVVATARLVGLDMGVALIAVGIDRLIATATIVVLGALSSVALSRKLMAATLPKRIHSEAEISAVQNEEL